LSDYLETLMNSLLAAHGPLAIDLNSPGRYLTWSIFTVSEANLVLIAVMIAIFGIALLAPFPGRHRGLAATADTESGAAPEPAGATSGDDDADARMWTARLRRRALALLPPGKLLPDRQPAYVASWVYVFGVATLAALGMAIVSGFALALGGTDWWHANPVSHFFNSLHLWSVELFMAFMVIHLWGKFWMAAWRGRRALTWITGVIAFGAAVVECFTGYLSQQNFDSQWIATNGKDAFNAVGVGAFFNLMNFGQMLLWHVVLIPIILIALVGAHVLMVRVRGVSHPLEAAMPRFKLTSPRSWLGTASERRAARAADAAPWRGPTRRYDILKEGTIAGLVVLIVTFGLAGLLSSPDVPPVTVQSWAQVAPADFLGTAAAELDGTSLTATYGPPYNTNGSPQSEGFAPANWFGVTQPINSAQTFVISPLSKTAPVNQPLAAALAVYNAASPAQQQTWAANYGKAVTKVKFTGGNPPGPGPGPHHRKADKMSITLRRDPRTVLPDFIDWFEEPFLALRPYLGQAIKVEDYTEDGHYVVRAEIAGIDPQKELEVSAGAGYLTIHAHRAGTTEDKHRSEFRYGSFSRTIELPSGADTDDVTAAYADGILTIKIGVQEEHKDAMKRIQVMTKK
jgi:HSP20 family molecular chaperone IbpA